MKSIEYKKKYVDLFNIVLFRVYYHKLNPTYNHVFPLANPDLHKQNMEIRNPLFYIMQGK